MKHIKTVAVVLLSFALQACGNDPQNASEENFKTAINRLLTDDPLCIKISSFKGGIILNSFDFPELFEIKQWVRQSKGHKERLLLLFVKAGLVKAETGEFERKNPFSGRPEKINARRYSLTDKGKDVFKDKGFCYGVKQLVEITNYTEPTAQQGQSAVQVQYTYSKKITDDWVRNGAFEGWVREVEESVRTPKKKSITLVLTKKGWFSPWELR